MPTYMLKSNNEVTTSNVYCRLNAFEFTPATFTLKTLGINAPHITLLLTNRYFKTLQQK